MCSSDLAAGEQELDLVPDLVAFLRTCGLLDADDLAGRAETP